MTFSVIIPVYNAEKTIINTLNSVLDQSFCDYEIIIINDGSVDKSEEYIINKLSSVKKIYKYIKTVNRGVSSARNTGWHNASGEYLCFLDSDDVWHCDKLMIINQILQNYSCDFLGHLYQVGDSFHNIESYQVKKINIIQYLSRNLFQTSCVCLKRDIPLRFDESMSYCEDYDLFLNIVNSFDTYYVDCALTKLNRPQLTDGGLSQNKLKMRIGELKAYNKFCFKYKHFLPILPILIFWSLIKYIKLYLNLFFYYFRYN
jgi:glycosyltransferase involved in cell wall biosynthesis